MNDLAGCRLRSEERGLVEQVGDAFNIGRNEGDGVSEIVKAVMLVVLDVEFDVPEWKKGRSRAGHKWIGCNSPEPAILLSALCSDTLYRSLAGLISPLAVFVDPCANLLLSIVYGSGRRESGVRRVVAGWWRRMQGVHVLEAERK